MSNEKSLKIQIIKQLEDDYANDLLDSAKCEQLLCKLQEQHLECIKVLNLEGDSSTIASIVNDSKRTIQEAEALCKEAKELQEEVDDYLTEVYELKETIEEHFDKWNTYQSTLQYFKVAKVIEGLSLELEKEIKNNDNEQCATIYANLCEISRNLIDSKAINLKNHLKESLIYWHNVLKSKFAAELEDILKVIKWPFVSANFSLQTPSQTNIQKMQTTCEYLLQVELPEEITTPAVTSGLLSGFQPLCLPIYYMLLPLRKRFLYHFYGNRQTNRIDKPEWYFTQILSWIRDHVDFVVKWIQPLIDKLGMHHIDVKIELMRGLVQLAVEKLNSELPNLQCDDYTLSHNIDEALGFEKELRETYNYPPTQPSIVAVLTQGPIFLKWLTMEKKYAIEKMDLILLSNVEAFQNLTTETEDIKVTGCADAVVTLLQTITDRYESLPQPGHRLQFLQLQLDLLDDFRVRLVQLMNADDSDIGESYLPAIANTIYYIENVLVDWGSMLHFLNLYYYKNQMENAGSGNGDTHDREIDFDLDNETVFADILSLYRRLRKELLHTIVDVVIIELKTRSKSYRNERWSAMTVQNDFRTLSLTPSACFMFEILAKRLHQLQKSLTHKLFIFLWRCIAQQLDNHLFEDLVLDSKFNEGGAVQFKFDMTRNLFPLFAQFSEKPQNHFVQIHESCNLLNVSKGSALLLRETLIALEGATGVEDRRGQALKEVGVNHFTPKMAVEILNKRTDITVNRISID